MPTFVKYDTEKGDILSVLKLDALPPGVELPFGPLGQGEGVLEATSRPELDRLEALELHRTYRVNPGTKRLVKKQR